MAELPGRLGLAAARVPQTDRHGVLWLRYGRVYVENGTLRFVTAGTTDIERGDYAIPFQMLTAIVLEPGTAITHDAMRLLAAHGTGLVAAAEDGVRLYASFPHGPDRSARARHHARLWADTERRVATARRMYAFRLGEVLPATDMNTLRGMEGARSKEMYKQLAQSHGIDWRGRRYDRASPEATDGPNQAINHASTALYAAAGVAVAITGALAPLGFIHEDSGRAFSLDIADLYRDNVTLPAAFSALKQHGRNRKMPLERHVRKTVGEYMRKERVIGNMITRIKELLDDRSDHA